MYIPAFLLVALATPSASANIYGGNPQLTVHVVRPQQDLTTADVTLGKIRMHACGGGYTDYSVGQSVDLVSGYTQAIGAGDWCGVTFFWDDTLLIDGWDQYGAFTVSYSQSSTYYQIDPAVSPVALTPNSVTNGTLYPTTPPAIDVKIQ
jgi:hypothetical protein